jgi:hypothetical protein
VDEDVRRLRAMLGLVWLVLLAMRGRDSLLPVGLVVPPLGPSDGDGMLSSGGIGNGV